MPKLEQFALPDVGEGLTEAEILSWRVRPGDTVTVNQVICEIETAKAAVELPSPYAGVVRDLLVAEGDTVDVGTPIIVVDTDPSAVPGTAAAEIEEVPAPASRALAEELVPTPERPAPGPVAIPAAARADEGRTAVLVGYGPRTSAAVRRPRKGVDVVASPPLQPRPTRLGGLEVGRAVEQNFRDGAPTTVRAKPPVRKLAKDLGVDLATVVPSGPSGTVTREDVLHAAEPASGALAARPAPDATLGAPGAARETRTPVRGVRKHTAAAMVASAFTAPHVTEWVSADVTRSMKLLARLREQREWRDVKLGPTLLAAKALLLAVRRHPDINASWDEASGEIVVKHYVNLGIAAATPRGLVVPNVKDADRLSLRELADALAALAATAREGRTAPSDLSGGTITITNVGVFRVDGGTPILNPGEAAILCLGQVRELPWVHKGAVKPRQVLQLGLSFDHRLVDGELGSRVLADVAAVLERPETALLWA